ncbi:unnamed protein product, partial [Ceratitis capitata]
MLDCWSVQVIEFQNRTGEKILYLEREEAEGKEKLEGESFVIIGPNSSKENWYGKDSCTTLEKRQIKRKIEMSEIKELKEKRERRSSDGHS